MNFLWYYYLILTKIVSNSSWVYCAPSGIVSPNFDNVKPYQQIPFQYSAHYEHNQKVEHFEFLAQDSISDYREDFSKNLMKDMR